MRRAAYGVRRGSRVLVLRYLFRWKCAHRVCRRAGDVGGELPSAQRSVLIAPPLAPTPLADAEESYRRSPESERSRRSERGRRGDPEEKEKEKDKSKRENEEKSL